MAYVYMESEPGCWTVGYWNDGDWMPASDHETEEEAVNRVAYLNGSSAIEKAIMEAIGRLHGDVKALHAKLDVLLGEEAEHG